MSSLSADSSPRIDGFMGQFFQGCWSIVQNDMVDMVQGFFYGDYLHPRLTVTSLTLIPKVSNPRTLADFRPISLSTFASTVVSKILATWLAQYLPVVINEQQFGFVKGRSIHESIALAQEMVDGIHRRSEGENIIFKYDMLKAYDIIEWRFLLRALRATRFSNEFQDLIYHSVCNIKYRVCVNGFYSGEFRSMRGAEQEDPLSPLLFIIAH